MEITKANKNGVKKEECKEKSRVEVLTKEEEKKKKQFHVLVVDDDPTQRKITEVLLRKSSQQVTSVDSGFKALEYLGIPHNPQHNVSASNASSHMPHLQGMKVDLIMTDYTMPRMNGYQLLIFLKSSAWKDIPVIIMSSDNVESRISECLKEGAERFLRKPLKASDIHDLHPILFKSLGINQPSSTTHESNNNNDVVPRIDLSEHSSINTKVLCMRSSVNQVPKFQELTGL